MYGYGHDEAARLVAEKLTLSSPQALGHNGAEALSGEEQSRHFLTLLDPSARDFTFQTFDDDRARKNPALVRTIQSLPTARDELQKLNEQGAGVSVTINETNGSGRKSQNIKRIRAVWQEDDDAFDGEFPLHPSIVVESSPGKYHRYWLVADDWPADEQGRTEVAIAGQKLSPHSLHSIGKRRPVLP